MIVPKWLRGIVLVVVATGPSSSCLAFQTASRRCVMVPRHGLFMAETTTISDVVEPQVLATGYSQQMDMAEAIRQATEMALQALPKSNENSKIDLAIISISSVYDGNTSPSTVVPAVLEAAKRYGKGIQHLVGSTNGGFISSMANSNLEADQPTNNRDDHDQQGSRACSPVEQEGVQGVSVMFCILPDVSLKVRFLKYFK
jgi:hypothetical protein